MIDEQTLAECERWCLGSCFLAPIASAPFMRPEIFSARGRRLLDAARSAIASNGVSDIGLATAHLRANQNGEAAQDIDYLENCLESIPRSANVEWYARKLAEHYRQRQAQSAAFAAHEAIQAGEPPGDIREHLQAALDHLARSEDELPTPLDLEAIMQSAAIEPVPWAVQGLFAKQDIVVIGGEGGTGKSIVALDIAIALSTGTQFLGMRVTEPQTVLYLDEENQGHVVRRRIRQHLVGRGIETAPTNFKYLNQQSITYHTPEARSVVAALIDRYQPQWIVLDSYVRFRGGDENSNTDAAEFAAAMKAERCRSGVGWLVLTHLAKPSKDRPDAVHRIRGASDIVNSSDALLTLEGDRQTDRRTLTPQQRRTATLAPLEITWRESDDEQSAQLICLGSEHGTGERAVERSLRLAERSGLLRPDLEAIVEREGYQDPKRAASRILGKLAATGTTKTRREGRFARIWLAEYAPAD